MIKIGGLRVDLFQEAITMAHERENPSEERGHAGGEAALHSKKVSAAELAMYLKGINFPADKQKITETARTNRAPKNVMDWIDRLPKRDYKGP